MCWNPIYIFFSWETDGRSITIEIKLNNVQMCGIKLQLDVQLNEVIAYSMLQIEPLIFALLEQSMYNNMKTIIKYIELDPNDTETYGLHPTVHVHMR